MFLCAMGALGALVFFGALMAFVADRPSYLKRQHRKPYRDKESTKQHQRHSERDALTSTIIKENEPPSDEDEAYTASKERDRLDYTSFAVSALTLIIVFIYTGINYYLYQATKEQFALANSPSISIEATLVSLDFSDPYAVACTVRFCLKNNGRSVATGVFVNSDLIHYWAMQPSDVSDKATKRYMRSNAPEYKTD
jgi:hypothetical protein